MKLIETHCHIHDLEAFPDANEALDRAREAGVYRFVVVGVQPADWYRALEFAEQHEDVYAICGWHPNYTAEYDPIDLPKLAHVLRHPKIVALGEIGLDYHWDYAPHSIQHQALKDQLKLAEAMDLPVVFHAREAYSDLLDVLERRPPRPYLFHCFTGSKEEMRRVIRIGGLVGVDGPLTYKNADELRKTFSIIPPSRIVLETDSPYMAPVPNRGKRNEPAFIPNIVSVLAELQQVTVEECAAQTTENALGFFTKMTP